MSLSVHKSNRAKSSRKARASRLTPEDAAAGSADTAPLSALERGQHALCSWDYDEARRHFEQALTETRSEPAAFALMELLVEHLALDEEALVLVLPASTLSSRVTSLLAAAHARTGEARQAVALLRDIDPDAEVPLRILLAERAAREGAISDLRSHLEALYMLDPANRAVSELASALQSLETTLRAPLERRLEEALQLGEPSAIEGAAEALLRGWPCHGGARAALRRLVERQKESEGRALLASAAAHAEAKRWELAVADLQQAGARGLEVGAALEQTRCAMQVDRAARAIEGAAGAARDGDLSPYLALPASLRAKVRAACDDPGLVLLEKLVSERARDPLAGLQAMALARAELSEGRLRAALDRLQAAGICELPSARALVREIEREIEGEQRAQAAAALEQLDLAFSRSSVAEVRALLGMLRVEHLPDPARGQTLAEAARSWLAREDTVASFERLMLEDPFEARILAFERLDDPDWCERLLRVEQRLAGLYPNRIVPGWAEGLHDASAPAPHPSVDTALEADGRHAWLVEVEGRFCFLRRVEIATSKVISCVVLRLPQTLERPKLLLYEDLICLADARGAALFAHVVEDTILRVLAFREGAPRGGEIDILPACDPLLRGLLCDQRMGQLRYQLWSPIDNRIESLGNPLSALPVRLPGAGDRIVVLTLAGEVRLVDPETRDYESAGHASRLLGVAPRPGGEGGLVCLGAFPPGGRDTYGLAILEPGSICPLVRKGLPQVDLGVHVLASALSPGLIFLLCRREGQTELMAFDADLRLLWSQSQHRIAHLLTDPDQREVVAVYHTAEGLWLTTLGRKPPSPPSAEASAEESQQQTRRAIGEEYRSLDHSESFRSLDRPFVWKTRNLAALTRLALAACLWKEAPWGQRMHAAASFVAEWDALEQCGQIKILQDQWPEETAGFRASRARALEWLDARSCSDMFWIATSGG